MAVAIRGTTPGTTSGTGDPTSVVLNGTRQPNTNDVLVIIHCNNFYDHTNIPTPTVDGSSVGVTAITNGASDSGTNLAHIKSFTFVVGSTGDLTVAVDETGSANEEKALIVYVLSGVDTATPIDIAGNTAGGSDVNLIAPSISPTSSDAFLICHANEGGGAYNGPFTPPGGGFTEQYDISVGGAMSAVGGTEQLAASGATGTRTFDGATNATSWGSVSIAVKSGVAAEPPGVIPLPGPRPFLTGPHGLIRPWLGSTGEEVVPADATVTPDAIVLAFVVPQVSVSVEAAPAVIALAFTIPAPAVTVGIAPASIALAFAVPQVAVSVGVAPATVALAFVIPQVTATESTIVEPATIAFAFTIPAPTVSVGVAPVVIALAFVIPQVTADGGEAAQLPTPPLIVGLQAVRRAYKARQLQAQPFVDLGAPLTVDPADATVTPAAIALAFTIPQMAVSVGVSAPVLAFGPIVNQVTVSVGVAPASISLAFVIPQVSITVPDATVSPATIALAFSVLSVTIDAEFLIDKPWKLLGGGPPIRRGHHKYSIRRPGWN